MSNTKLEDGKNERNKNFHYEKNNLVVGSTDSNIEKKKKTRNF